MFKYLEFKSAEFKCLEFKNSFLALKSKVWGSILQWSKIHCPIGVQKFGGQQSGFKSESSNVWWSNVPESSHITKDYLLNIPEPFKIVDQWLLYQVKLSDILFNVLSSEYILIDHILSHHFLLNRCLRFSGINFCFWSNILRFHDNMTLYIFHTFL